MAVLEVHRGARSLLVLADGTRWIRDGFEGLGLQDKAMIVCWYHLKKRCEQCLSRACRGRDHRRAGEAPVLEALWHGRAGEAIEMLRSRAGEMKNVEAYGRRPQTAMPLAKAHMACSRMPKWKLRPPRSSGEKANEPSKVCSVIVEGARSPAPPSSHGTRLATALSTLPPETRVARPLGSGGKLGISASQS